MCERKMAEKVSGRGRRRERVKEYEATRKKKEPRWLVIHNSQSNRHPGVL